jgi:hypothetical protein
MLAQLYMRKQDFPSAYGLIDSTQSRQRSGVETERARKLTADRRRGWSGNWREIRALKSTPFPDFR